MGASPHGHLGKRSRRQSGQESSQTKFRSWPGKRERPTDKDISLASNLEDLGQEADKNRMDKQLESGNERKNHIQAYPAAITQDPATTPWTKEVAECSAHLDAHRENWAERLPVEEKSAGSRRPRIRLRRRTANYGLYPTKVSDIQRRTAKGIWEGRTNRPKGNLKRAKTSHKGN